MKAKSYTEYGRSRLIEGCGEESVEVLCSWTRRHELSSNIVVVVVGPIVEKRVTSINEIMAVNQHETSRWRNNLLYNILCIGICSFFEPCLSSPFLSNPIQLRCILTAVATVNPTPTKWVSIRKHSLKSDQHKHKTSTYLALTTSSPHKDIPELSGMIWVKLQRIHKCHGHH